MTDRTGTDKALTTVLDGLRFAMLATADDKGTWKSRPLSLAAHDGSRLSFLVSDDADWVGALEDGGSPATLTFSDPGKNTYVALQGSARAVDARARVHELWNPGAAAYFEGKDDPSVRVLDVEVHYGEHWDGPSGRVGALLTVASAAVGHNVGEQGRVLT